jgi:hypothetical protein
MAPRRNVALALATLAGAKGSSAADDTVASLVGNMTSAEKYAMLNGVGFPTDPDSPSAYDNIRGYYIGNIPGVPRLGIPSLNMQDAGQGFRTSDAAMVGQVTSWSCGLGESSPTLLCSRCVYPREMHSFSVCAFRFNSLFTPHTGLVCGVCMSCDDFPGLASAWDTGLVSEWAGAVADEFKAKGANVILGPGLNLHRVRAVRMHVHRVGECGCAHR